MSTSSSSILFLFFFLTLANGIPQETLTTICSQTQNDETCRLLLTSDNRTDSADLPLLSLISIEATQRQAAANLDAFASLFLNSSTAAASSPALGKAYGTCVSLYEDIEESLRVVHELSRRGKYGDVIKAGPTTDPVYKCENGLPVSSPTGDATVDMLLVIETYSSVAEFVARSV